MFSVYNTTDTHIGQPGYFTNNITYDGTFNLTNESCGSQDFIIGLYKPNDTHISGNPNFYSWRLCSNDTECEVTAVCVYDTVGSLYQMNDSHFGSPDFYDLKLCCERVDRRDSGSGLVNITSGIVTEEIIEEEEFVDKVMELIKGNYFWFIGVLIFIIVLIFIFLCWLLFLLLGKRRKKEEEK